MSEFYNLGHAHRMVAIFDFNIIGVLCRYYSNKSRLKMQNFTYKYNTLITVIQGRRNRRAEGAIPPNFWPKIFLKFTFLL